MHNVAGQEDPVNGYLREDLVDATLTEVGIDQCKQLRSSSEIESVMSSQLLVVSPMRRTLQTASTIFDGLLKCPWIALEYIREQVGGACMIRYIFLIIKTFFYDIKNRVVSILAIEGLQKQN